MQSNSGSCYSTLNGVTNACSHVDVTYNSNNTAGNLLIAVGYRNMCCGAGSIADSNGNTWTLAGTDANFSGWGGVDAWYVCSAKAGPNTVTYSFNTGDGHLHIYEVSGVVKTNCFDQWGANLDNPLNASETVTTASPVSQANEYVLAGFASPWVNATWIAGAGYTVVQQTINPNGSCGSPCSTGGPDSFATEERNSFTGLSGQLTATASTSNGTIYWHALILTFRGSPVTLLTTSREYIRLGDRIIAVENQ